MIKKKKIVTYAESIGEKPFDWWDALNNPEKYKDVDLLDLSGEWVTCACGNQCDVIPRSEDGQPVDNELLDLGYRFHNHIKDQSWDYAKVILSQIEERSAFLIAEIKQEKKRKK